MIYIQSGNVGTDYALDHPRLCFHKWDATVTATNSADGADATWLDDGETWSQWEAGSSTVTVTLTYSETRAITYVGIAAHTLDLAGSTITLEIDTGAGFAEVPGLVDLEPTDDSAILFLLSPVDVDAVRLVVTGDSAPKIAVMQAGLEMAMPRRSTFTALPISESEQVRLRHAKSVKGQVLGTSVEAAELGFDVEVAHLSEEWREASGDASWQALTAHTREGNPLFVATKPSKYADDVAYGVLTERARFNRAIPNKAISGQVALSFMGYKRP